MSNRNNCLVGKKLTDTIVCTRIFREESSSSRTNNIRKSVNIHHVDTNIENIQGSCLEYLHVRSIEYIV